MHRALQQVQGLIAQQRASDDFTICLDPGVHTLGGQPLVLDASFNRPDNGRVVWRSTEPQRPAIVDGGIQLSNWLRCDGDGRAHCPGWQGVWVHAIKDVEPTLPHSLLPVRQLWVDGLRAERVYTDLGKMKLVTNEKGFHSALPPVHFDGWVHDQVEFRWPKHFWAWIEPRCVVTGVTWAPGGTQLIVEPGCWQAMITRANGLENIPAPTFADNIGSAPPKAGEFSASPEFVFYRPPLGKENQRPADAWVPYQERLLDAENLVNHEWHHVHFRHATWRQPNRPGGYVPSQTVVTALTGEPSGAIDIRQSQHIVFDQCSFVDLGSAYALAIHHRCQNAQVTRSHIARCSGGAIKLGNTKDVRAIRTDPSEMDENFLVRQNTLEDIALEFRDAAAVFAGFVRRTTIEQNTIKRTGYTGISLGWGWGAHVHGDQTWARDNHVRRNLLVDVMSALNDGGCIYTLGPQPGSTVEGNYCKSDHAEQTGFFYFDNGSRYFKVRDNIADTGPGPCINLQGCCDQPALDIDVSNLWCRATNASKNGCQEQNCRIDESTQYVLRDANAEFPTEAQAIIDAAGAAPAAAAVHYL